MRGTRGIEPELHGGDDDLEGGGVVGQGRPGPVNANMRLRTRPPNVGTVPMGNVPMANPSVTGEVKGHTHGS